MSDLDQYDLPEAEEILQLERDPGAKTHDVMPVRVEGIVQTESPGGRTTTFRLFNVDTTVANRILDDDGRRATATIVALDNDIRLGFTQSDALSNGSIRWPAGVPLVINTSDEVWAAGDTAATDVSVVGELWAR